MLLWPPLNLRRRLNFSSCHTRLFIFSLPLTSPGDIFHQFLADTLNCLFSLQFHYHLETGFHTWCYFSLEHFLLPFVLTSPTFPSRNLLWTLPSGVSIFSVLLLTSFPTLHCNYQSKEWENVYRRRVVLNTLFLEGHLAKYRDIFCLSQMGMCWWHLMSKDCGCC